MGKTTLRGQVHAVWETFFPSSLYLLLCVAAFVTISHGDAWPASIAQTLEETRRLKTDPAYLLLKEFKLEATLPIALLLTAAAAVYFFDRIVFALDRTVPPVMAWTGNPALYAAAPLVIQLWARLDAPGPENLHIRAREIVDGALAKGEAPSHAKSTREAGAKRFSNAAQAAGYGKAGALFSAAVLAWNLLTSSRAPGDLRWGVLFIGGFLLFYLANYVRSTVALVRQAEQEIGLATSILGPGQAPISQDREAGIRSQFRHALEREPRFLAFHLRHRRPSGGNLWAAILGFRLASRLRLVRLVDPARPHRP